MAAKPPPRVAKAAAATAAVGAETDPSDLTERGRWEQRQRDVKLAERAREREERLEFVRAQRQRKLDEQAQARREREDSYKFETQFRVHQARILRAGMTPSDSPRVWAEPLELDEAGVVVEDREEEAGGDADEGLLGSPTSRRLISPNRWLMSPTRRLDKVKR